MEQLHDHLESILDSIPFSSLLALGMSVDFCRNLTEMQPGHVAPFYKKYAKSTAGAVWSLGGFMVHVQGISGNRKTPGCALQISIDPGRQCTCQGHLESMPLASGHFCNNVHQQQAPASSKSGLPSLQQIWPMGMGWVLCHRKDSERPT